MYNLCVVWCVVRVCVCVCVCNTLVNEQTSNSHYYYSAISAIPRPLFSLFYLGGEKKEKLWSGHKTTTVTCQCHRQWQQFINSVPC